MSEPIIETQDIVKHFGGRDLLGSHAIVHAVDGVNLTVNRGETFAIVGESGCGKSTLARLLLRLLEPTSGKVIYNGTDLTSLSPNEMRKLRAEMQFVFQDPFSSLNPRMTVGQLIEEPLLVHSKLSRSERRAKVRELLQQVGLGPQFANRYPHEFSGGQRQRIGVARALASGPKLLIGDEPVSALDVSVQAQIINLLEDLKQAFGLTLIIIAHDLAVIRHMSDRVAVMYLGQVVEMAETNALFETPLHPYAQALLSAIPVPVPGREPAKSKLTGDVPSPVAPPSGCRFHTRCPHATELCSETEPVLTSAGDGHFVACHHYKTIAAAGRAVDAASGRTAAADKRFALYQQHSQKSGMKTPA